MVDSNPKNGVNNKSRSGYRYSKGGVDCKKCGLDMDKVGETNVYECKNCGELEYLL